MSKFENSYKSKPDYSGWLTGLLMVGMLAMGHGVVARLSGGGDSP